MSSSANKISDSKILSTSRSSEGQSSKKTLKVFRRTNKEPNEITDDDSYHPYSFPNKKRTVYVVQDRPQNAKIMNQNQRNKWKEQPTRNENGKMSYNSRGISNQGNWRYFNEKSLNMKLFPQNQIKRNDITSTQNVQNRRKKVINIEQISKSNKIEQIPKDVEDRRSVVRELVGVIVSPVVIQKNKEENYVQFLVYHYQSRKFTKIIFVKTKNLPTCTLGNWLRLKLPEWQLADLERNGHKPFMPSRTIPCQRRIMTRIMDGHVNFYVLANISNATRQNGTNDRDQKIVYASRLGKLHLDRNVLIDPFSIQNGNDDIPHRLQLWCYVSNKNIDDLNGKEKNRYFELKFNLKRIDERYYIKDENNPEEEDHSIVEDLQNGCNLNENQIQISDTFYDWFNGLIKKQYEEHKLLEGKNELIQNFLDDFLNLLRRELHMPQLNLELFGSINSGFADSECDLDICLVDNGIKINYRERILIKIIECLRSNNDFRQITSVLDARIPIIKFENIPTGFRGDICVENKLAIFNTKLLKLYSQFDDRVPILGSAIKRWAKLFGLHGASMGSISSYAYIVMLIHYLQQIQPPILPFLQEPSTDSKTIIDESIEGWEVKFEENIEMLKEDSKFCNHQTLAQLIIGFFNFYGKNFSPFTDVVQIRTSKEFNKSHKNMPTVYKLSIEDPFDLSHNLTSGVHEKTLVHILKCFLQTGRGLEKFAKDYFPENAAEFEVEAAGCSHISKTVDGSNVVLDDMDFSKLLCLFKQRRFIQLKKKKVNPIVDVDAKQNKSGRKTLKKNALEEEKEDTSNESTNQNGINGSPAEKHNTNRGEKKLPNTGNATVNYKLVKKRNKLNGKLDKEDEKPIPVKHFPNEFTKEKRCYN